MSQSIPVGAAATGSESARSGWHRILDWRPTSILARIGIVLLLVAPLAIAGTMMWAMWDPSKYMRDIKLAVVNEDAGVESRGEYTNYGDQITEGLMEADYLNFTKLSKEEAQDGLNKGKYMMVISIPQNFSEKAVTIISDDPQRPEIDFATNDFYGTNSSVITASLIPSVQSKVENAITKKYADKVIKGLTNMSEGLSAAADGAAKLDQGAAKLQDGGGKAVDGIAKLDDGAGQLNDGAGQLTAGTAKLNSGVGELSTGATKLDDGAHQLSAGMDTLVGGTGQLADGAGQIEGGVKQLTDMLIPLLTQAQQVSPQLIQAQQALRAAGLNAEADKVADIAAKLDPANSENMVNKLGQLRDGTALLHQNLSDPNSAYLGGMLKLQDGAHQLADGTTALNAGIGQLSTGAGALDEGANKLAGGIGTLKDGTGQLREGGTALKDGMDQLKDGTGQLSTKLAEGAAKAPKITKPDVSAQNMANPVTFTSTNPHPVQVNTDENDPTAKQVSGGVSMLLLMVFGFLIMLLLALVLPYLYRKNGKVAAQRGSATAAVLGGWGLHAAVNFGVLAILAIVSHSMGWNPASWGGVIAALLFTAAAAAGVYQLFQVIFGRATGGAFGLGYYVLGLMTFGGVWPVAAIPVFLRPFHWLHVMTFAKNAFTHSTDGLLSGSFFAPLAALTVITLICLGISVAVLRVRRSGRALVVSGQEEHMDEAVPALA